MSTRNEKKAAHERAAFEEFAKAAGLDVAAGSVVSKDSPEPDILCQIAGAPYYFELGRLLDERHPKMVAEAIRRLKKGDERPVGGAVSKTEPMVKMLRDKTSNKYKVDGTPVDLLLYYDDETAETADAAPPAGPGGWREWAEMYMLPEIKKDPGQVSRFWVFDRDSATVLWAWTRACRSARGGPDGSRGLSSERLGRAGSGERGR